MALSQTGSDKLLRPRHRASPSRSGSVASTDLEQQVGRYFTDLRLVLNVSPIAIMRAIKTTPDVLQALENGRIAQLPHAAETSRVVMQYCALAECDGRPVLAAISELMRRETAADAGAGPSVIPSTKRFAMPLRIPKSALPFSALPSRLAGLLRRRPARSLYGLSLPLAALVIALNTGTLEAAMDHIPRPVARGLASIRNYLDAHLQPSRHELRWIVVDDPRSRRADKLKVAAQ